MNSSQASRPLFISEHLANERTYLAWVRTSLALIGLGFVLARMGLFLRQLAATTFEAKGRPIAVHASGELLVSGVVFLLIGTLVCGISAHRYRTNRRTINQNTFEPAGWSIVALTAVVVLGGLVISALVLWRTLGPAGF